MDPVEADLDARLEARESDHLQSLHSRESLTVAEAEGDERAVEAVAPEAGDDPQVAVLLRSALRTLSRA